MRRLLLLGSLFAGTTIGVLIGLSAGAGATPADPEPRTITQPDGSTFVGRLYGDEYLNGVETEAGFTLVQGPDGTWTFARPTERGRLVPSGLLPDADGRPPAGAELVPHLRDEVAQAEADAERTEAAEGGGPGTPPATGTQPLLVILTQFSNRALSTTAADWSDLFFGADQSVADFYDEASYGTFDVAPAAETNGVADDGVIVVSLPTPHPNSGNDFFSFQDTAAAAVQAAGASVDFAAFDAVANGGNGDGALSPDELHIGIVVAGTEAAQSCNGPSVWGHRSALDSPVTLDGVVVGDDDENSGYFTGGELQCDGPPAQATLGIWAHEFGHDLGWIDLYDSDGSSGGVDTWSVMGLHWLALDSERSGTRPPLPDPFSRTQVGWLSPTQITTASDDVALDSSATTADVIQVLDNPDGVDVGFLTGGGTGEYFLVENREQEGYDIAVRGCGALVWHIDETAFNADDDARRVDVEEAGDGAGQGGFADSEDPFPSEHPPNAVFGPNSSPDSGLNSGLPSGVAMTDFSPACGPSVTLDVDPAVTVGRAHNDRFSNAIPLRLFEGESTAFRSARSHNVGATHQPNEPVHDGAAGRSSVWFSFRAPRAGFVNLTTISTFREVAAVYTGPYVGNLTRVESVRGGPPGGGVGSPPAPENINRGLGFRVERRVRYFVAVDSLQAGHTGGVRLLLDYSSARPDVRPVRRVVEPGQRPELRVQIRNTSTFDRLRVYNLLEGDRGLQALDCPAAFVIQPGEARTCRVRTPVTGASGATLRGKVWAWLEWIDSQRFSAVADTWFARVR